VRDGLSVGPVATTLVTPIPALAALGRQMDGCDDVLEAVTAALTDEPPAVMNTIGAIRPGYSEELDRILEQTREAREWIANLEPNERRRTGIPTIKVGFNKVFGYYIEVSNGQTSKVPDDYIRKQTLVNAERYITPELKEYETLVLNA